MTGSPPRSMELMAVPKANLKPKKVSAVEPETIRFSNFANLDEVPMIYGAKYEQTDLVAKMPEIE